MRSILHLLVAVAVCVTALAGCSNKQLDDSAARRAPARTGTNLPHVAPQSEDESDRPPEKKKPKKSEADPDYAPRRGFR